MIRTLTLLSALLAGPALAAPAHYQAQPAAAPAQQQLVARDNVWRCGDAGCVSTNESASRPAIVCAALVRQIGEVRSFSNDGRAFGADELQACNARARH